MNPDQPQEHKARSKSGNNRKTKETKLKNIRSSSQRGAKASALRNPKNERFKLQRAAQIEHLTAKVPTVNITAKLPPPDVVAVIGPAQSGKTTIVKQLIKQWTGVQVTPIGPVTVSASKTKRITIFDVPSNIPAVLDAARVADLVIIVINAEKDIETDVFEYLNVLQAIGFPKVFTVVTHEDCFAKVSHKQRNNKKLRERIYKEIYQGSKIFFLDWQSHSYKNDQMATLSRCISQQNYNIPLSWRSQHGCVLVDRVEQHVNNTTTCFGFVHGTFINTHQKFHIPGYQDVDPVNFEVLQDPAMPENRKVLQKEKPVVYGPMSEINDVRIDDAGVHVKINLKQTPGRLGREEKDVISSLKASLAVSKQGIQLLDDAEQDLNHILPSDQDEPEEQEFLCEEHSENIHEDINEITQQNQWLVDETKGNDSYPKSVESFESTASNLDDVEIQEEKFEIEEQQQELEEANLNNEEFRVNHILKKLKLNKQQASQQYWADLIYNFHKTSVSSPTQKAKDSKKQKILQLFEDDEIDQNLVNIQSLPASFCSVYGINTFSNSQIRGITKQFPTSFSFKKQIGQEASINIMLSTYIKNAFITTDIDFSTALSKCLNGEQPVVEQEVKDTNQYKLDSQYHDNLTHQANQAKQRETLLNPSLQLKETRFPPGSYVKFTFDSIPEFQQNLDPHNPLILGALLPQETNKKFITARIKRHRWYPKILKSRNPLIFAMGWRRFQSLPTFASEQMEHHEANLDTALVTDSPPLKMLKYTPEHMHCAAIFFGYGVPAGTGVICFQNLNSKTWRVAATGTTLESGEFHHVFKRLKLVGFPDKIMQKTCYLKDMFNTKNEASAFVGAEVKTVSGIRGILKKGEEGGRVICKFEDRVRMTDVMFLKTNVKVKIDKICINFDNHVSKDFVGVRTVAEIRHEKGITLTYNNDSQYQKEQKEIFVKPELHINEKVMKQLPFAEQKKHFDKNQDFKKQNIKDQYMKSLVQGKKQFDRERIVQLATKIQNTDLQDQLEKQSKELHAQQQWKKGMNKKKDNISAEKKKEESTKKRVIIGRAQQRVLKRGKL
ncbi:Ribosome biogenesis protein BMS1 [Spironucleus salmonicida]|uniref:Ribosome biogenesis protein BMS1 n=1 Tax=Spironucleus salmonicida TaxID=348837 RepID=V6LWC1_9EUKA|nr:Ribosome biogenesis protein BMS1 [Spironucleus salmonicida]|eukprot:EST45109.1 Ribosome biogenesis protein BMS1 [Spironucleus salmonicida]